MDTIQLRVWTFSNKRDDIIELIALVKTIVLCNLYNGYIIELLEPITKKEGRVYG